MRGRIHIIGFPMDLGADRRGVDMGPSAIRIADLAPKLRALGHEVSDHGDIRVRNQEIQVVEDSRLKYLPEIERSCHNLSEAVYSALESGSLPLILGGDHSMSIGSISGVAKHCKQHDKSLGVLWIDAHADMNTALTSPTGNIHGMPLAVAMGFGHPSLTSIGGEFRKLDPANLVMVGLRSVDEGERDLIKREGIEAYTMFDIDRLGMYALIAESLTRLTNRVDHLHVSFDLDSVDPTVASGVGTPVPGGLSYREAHLIMEMLADTGRVSSLEVAEVNPILDDNNKSARLAAELIASCFGKRIL